MWKKLLLYRLLEVTTNSVESFRQAAQYFMCFPRVEKGNGGEDYEVVHYEGQLKKKDDAWIISNGFEQVPIKVSHETVRFRMQKHVIDPVHVFAAVPILDPDEDFANCVDKDDNWKIPQALLITTDDICQMVENINNIRDQYRILRDFYFFPIDQKITIHRFMTNKQFAVKLANCLGYMAAAKVDPNYFSMRNDDLVEQYNNIVGENAVDLFRVLSFLDVVSSVLLLDENSVVIQPTWLNFLAAYAVTMGCSVWSVPEKNLAQIILNEVPNTVMIPTHMLSWTLKPAMQNMLVKDLLKIRGKKKKEKVRKRLIQFLCNGVGLTSQTVSDTLRYLMLNGGLEDENLEKLMTDGNYALLIKDYLRREYDLSL